MFIHEVIKCREGAVTEEKIKYQITINISVKGRNFREQENSRNLGN